MHLSPLRVKWQTNKSTIYTVAKRQIGPFSLLSAIITIVTFIVVTIIIIIIIIITIITMIIMIVILHFSLIVIRLRLLLLLWTRCISQLS